MSNATSTIDIPTFSTDELPPPFDAEKYEITGLIAQNQTFTEDDGIQNIIIDNGNIFIIYIHFSL